MMKELGSWANKSVTLGCTRPCILYTPINVMYSCCTCMCVYTLCMRACVCACVCVCVCVCMCEMWQFVSGHLVDMHFLFVGEPWPIDHNILKWENYCSHVLMGIPYSQKIWWGIKFGGLACNRQIKFHQCFILAYIHMSIPYRTAKFKSANIFTMAI